MIRINDEVAIDESELRFETARSSGPGGQNVNKLETKVTLRFDVGATTSLTPDHKMRIRDALRTRITRRGVLRLTSQRHRTQEANRRAVLDKFVELLADALTEAPERRATHIPEKERRRRLEAKRRRSSKKQLRSRVDPEE